jgi:protein tyrosine/serine phosphatase
MSVRHPLKLAFLSLALFAAAWFCLAADRGKPASYGILNFGKVNDHLYRGAEPDSAGLTNLASLGIKTIIDLRTPREVWAREASKSAAAGMSYTNVPLDGLGRPTDEQVDHILGLIESSPGPVFVHCEHGCDRTGTIVACYRIRHDHWTIAEAMTEADGYGLSKLERGMRSYLAAFAANAADAEKSK